MGRELRRVPLDFDWPLNKVWQGFVNPHYKECPEADKTCHNGYNHAGRWLDAISNFIAHIGWQASRGETSAWDDAPQYRIPPNVPLSEVGPYLRERRPIPLTSEFKDFVLHLMKEEDERAWYPGYKVFAALREAAGLPVDWGRCPVCKGENLDPAVKEAYDNWKEEPPPTGEGWQLWETVSEGSPISPVFPTKEAFIEYLVGQKYSRKAAENFCESGWVPSGVITESGRMYKDVECAEVLGKP